MTHRSTPTARESDAAQRLAEALLEFALAHEDGREHRRASRQKEIEKSRTPTEVLAKPQPKRPTEPDARGLLTTKAAAEYLSIGRRTLYSLTAPRGPIPVIRIGTSVRYPLAGLLEAMKKFEQTQ